VAQLPSALERHPLWDSGKVASDASIHRVYGGPALESGQRYYWQVRVWDDAGRSSAWSAPEYWEMGLLRPSDWSADWITPDLRDGWYRGRLAWGNKRNTYGKQLALLAQIVLRYADGHQQVIGTGKGWKAATGPILWSDIYDGESYDARLEKQGWSRPGYDDSGWAAVRVLDHSKQILVAPPGPPVRRIQEMKPVQRLVTPSGDTVFDLGQNMVGWVRLKVRGPRGTTVRLRHAEVLDRKGDFYTDNL